MTSSFEQGILETRLLEWLHEHAKGDAAHDIGHLKRVLGAARAIARIEGNCSPDVITAAALLHDMVHVSKDSPLRKEASRLSAERACELLSQLGMPLRQVHMAAHAIHAHSFSANVKPDTMEALVIQDADRLDAIGAIGIARCFTVSGTMNRAMFDPLDPLAKERSLDETKWAVDHFYTKLLGLASGMKTATARRMAEKRLDVMTSFLERLSIEAEGTDLADFTV